jgi:hypothetical protein
MKHYGNIDLNRNLLQNAVLPSDVGFPVDPLPGMIVFMNKKVYICAEIATGLPVWIPMTQEIDSYIFNQSTPQTAWTITHNLNTATALVQVFDQNSQAMIPDYIDTSVFNQVTVMFSSAQAGKAIVMLGSLSGSPKAIVTYSQSFTNLSTWVVAHGLGYYPEVASYIGGELVQPVSVVQDSTLQTTITFSSPQTGVARCV